MPQENLQQSNGRQQQNVPTGRAAHRQGAGVHTSPQPPGKIGRTRLK